VVDQTRLSLALAAAVADNGPDGALAVCQACVAWLPMTGASITMMDGGQGQEPVCATDSGAARIDELQFSLGDGPCVEAFTTGRAVLVPDITDPAEGRWPVFAAAAADTGARGMFVFPLHVGAAKIGVLDCYRDAPGSLSDHDLSGALRAADAAIWTLLDRVDGRTTGEGDPNGSAADEQLDGSTLARAEVHQATGMLIAQAALDATTALALLRGVAFSAGRSIADVAGEVVARRLRLDPDGAWHTAGTEHDTDHVTDVPNEPMSRDEETPP
jgi:hypothetical protein